MLAFAELGDLDEEVVLGGPAEGATEDVTLELRGMLSDMGDLKASDEV